MYTPLSTTSAGGNPIGTVTLDQYVNSGSEFLRRAHPGRASRTAKHTYFFFSSFVCLFVFFSFLFAVFRFCICTRTWRRPVAATPATAAGLSMEHRGVSTAAREHIIMIAWHSTFGRACVLRVNYHTSRLFFSFSLLFISIPAVRPGRLGGGPFVFSYYVYVCCMCVYIRHVHPCARVCVRVCAREPVSA